MIILAIESSCDDTCASIISDGIVLSNIIASQNIHQQYGGVVPEIASRAHIQNIVPVVNIALQQAQIEIHQIEAVAYTQAPGLIGSLLVGACFAKGFAQALNIPIITVHHLQAHVLAHFINDPKPQFPFLCLTVSGGHTQLVLCNDYLNMKIIGETIDDAAGEAFDKTAKMLGLPYPGGPLIDKLAKQGDYKKFIFPISKLSNYQYTFSGLKTSILYFLENKKKENPNFIAENIADICASVQYTIVETLLYNLRKAIKEYNIKYIGIAGGVSANSLLRKSIEELGKELGINTFVPEFQFCTDNAAMIAITAHYKQQAGLYSDLKSSPSARAVWQDESKN